MENRDKPFHIRRKQNKTQIMLTHTSRDLKFYMMTLKYRYGGNYERIPSYLISKDGEVTNFFEPKYSSNYFGVRRIDNRAVIISLENNGWLKKHHLSGKFMNWLGDIYFNKPFEKKWRGFGFWDSYSEKQYESLSKLIKELSVEFDIPLEFVGHNTKITGVQNYKGITSRSNYSDIHTDVSPAFDFKILKKHIDGKHD
tara:strand:+ start:7234 stop:7827 length:594 start_codon:yes stop_codon:yes gene_type:complete